MPVEEEIAIIYCGVNGLLENVPLTDVAEFEKQYPPAPSGQACRRCACSPLANGQLTDDVAAKLTAAANDVAATFC